MRAERIRSLRYCTGDYATSAASLPCPEIEASPKNMHFKLFASASNPLHFACMARSGRRFLFLLLLALVFRAGTVLAGTAEEDRAFAVAVDKFNSFPVLTERDFANFLQKYPNSVHVPEAILYQAQAMLFSGETVGAIDLLSTNQFRATTLAPQYLYWLGRAHLQNKDYPKAITAFAQLVQKYPDSRQAVDANVREAEAFSKQGEPQRVIQLLEQTNGLFQQAVHIGATSDTIASGYLLLGDARLSLNDFAGVDSALRALDKQKLDPDLKWQRDYLACRRQRADDRLEEALRNSAVLLVTANPTNRAAGVDFQAGVFEQLGNLDAAVNAYTNNLVPDAPPDQQRQAILKIAELDLKQNKLPDVVRRLSNFLEQFPAPKVSDLAVLTLGEVRLKQALSGSDTNLTGGDTNLFEKAVEQFDYLSKTFTNSPLIGKALLDRGWCLSSQGDVTNSQADFREATARLPFSEDQAEARFKWADSQFAMRDYAGAITNYNFIAGRYTSLPGVNQHGLIERALYQSMRAALAETNLAAAESAVENILRWFPDGFAGPHALLLTGQGLAEQNEPAAARKLFAEFEQRYPTNSLKSQIRLAIARSYEKEKNWQQAIDYYTAWTNTFPNNVLIPQAKFSLAWDTYEVGQDTNALMLFTNFIAEFPTNELSARAQYWLGDFYFRQPDYVAAEYNYQQVFKNTNWGAADLSTLRAEACMAAGRSAMERESYQQAISYFTNLMSLSDCPLDLQIQATVAYADATISGDSTNKVADLKEAIRSLATITNTEPNTWQAAQALGKIGDCYFDWGTRDPGLYTNAFIVYSNLAEAPYARNDARQEARFQLGDVVEKQAAQKTGEAQTSLLKNALSLYVDAFYQGLHDSAGFSPFWTKKSGRKAAELAESLQEWQSAFCLYDKLKTLLPVLAPDCDKKMDKAREHGAKPDQCTF